MELKQLQYFKAVSDTKNMTDASRILGVSQSTLTKSIQALEQEMQISLFEHIGRKLVLTDIGGIVLKYANAILENVEYMVSDIRSIRAGQTFRICLSHPSVMTKLSGFECAHSEIGIYITVRPGANFLYYLQKGLFDLTISDTPVVGEGIVSKPLFTDQLLLSVPASHCLYTCKSIFLRQLKNQTVITTNHPEVFPLFALFIDRVNRQNIPIDFRMQATTYACAEVARKTNWLYYLSSIDWDTWDLGENRRNIPIDPQERILQTYYFSYNSRQKHPEQDQLISWLSKSLSHRKIRG